MGPRYPDPPWGGVVDMFARAVQGESPEAAVKGAETEMKQIYG